MPVRSATVQQLTADVVNTPDPESALRALRALRLELDELEADLVTRALHAGASWSQIARALGVSKQAAHRKHRALADQAFQVGPGPRILVTSEARRSVQLARREATSLGQPTVGTEHLLLGILRCRQSHAVRALKALGVTHDRARLCLHSTIVGTVQAPEIDEDQADSPNGLVIDQTADISPHARRILEGSLREALKRGDGFIGVEHLLLALLADSRNGAVQTLEALKVSPTQVSRQLDREWLEISARQQPEPDSLRQPATRRPEPSTAR